MTISGKAPYSTPRIGSPYGGYIGMIGNWANWVRGCGGRLAWSASNSAAANTNYITYHKGIGTGVYWFAAGPGVDPHYNGTTREAYAWGVRQAAQTLGDMAGHRITYPVVFMDIELPGIAPAPDNGWNAVYTAPCSGRVKTPYIAPSVDRADFDGYRAYLLSLLFNLLLSCWFLAAWRSCRRRGGWRAGGFSSQAGGPDLAFRVSVRP